MSWYCEAYGPEGEKVGATCFFGEQGVRECGSAAICHHRMTLERQRTFARINELAAAGDADMAYLAEVFTSPEQLLGGQPGATAE